MHDARHGKEYHNHLVFTQHHPAHKRKRRLRWNRVENSPVTSVSFFADLKYILYLRAGGRAVSFSAHFPCLEHLSATWSFAQRRKRLVLRKQCPEDLAGQKMYSIPNLHDSFPCHTNSGDWSLTRPRICSYAGT